MAAPIQGHVPKHCTASYHPKRAFQVITVHLLALIFLHIMQTC